MGPAPRRPRARPSLHGDMQRSVGWAEPPADNGGDACRRRRSAACRLRRLPPALGTPVGAMSHTAALGRSRRSVAVWLLLVHAQQGLVVHLAGRAVARGTGGGGLPRRRVGCRPVLHAAGRANSGTSQAHLLVPLRRPGWAAACSARPGSALHQQAGQRRGGGGTGARACRQPGARMHSTPHTTLLCLQASIVACL